MKNELLDYLCADWIKNRSELTNIAKSLNAEDEVYAFFKKLDKGAIYYDESMNKVKKELNIKATLFENLYLCIEHYINNEFEEHQKCYLIVENLYNELKSKNETRNIDSEQVLDDYFFKCRLLYLNHYSCDYIYKAKRREKKRKDNRGAIGSLLNIIKDDSNSSYLCRIAWEVYFLYNRCIEYSECINKQKIKDDVKNKNLTSTELALLEKKYNKSKTQNSSIDLTFIHSNIANCFCRDYKNIGDYLIYIPSNYRKKIKIINNVLKNVKKK